MRQYSIWRVSALRHLGVNQGTRYVKDRRRAAPVRANGNVGNELHSTHRLDRRHIAKRRVFERLPYFKVRQVV